MAAVHTWSCGALVTSAPAPARHARRVPCISNGADAARGSSSEVSVRCTV